MGDYPEFNLEVLALCCLTLAWKMRNRNFAIHKLVVNFFAFVFPFSIFFTCSLLFNLFEQQAKHPHLRVITKQDFLSMELHILKKLDCLSKPTLESEQGATEGEPSDAGTSSQRSTDKGKEMASETTTEIRNSAEDSKGMKLDFPLRWPVGVAWGEGFSILHHLILPPHQIEGEPELAQLEYDLTQELIKLSLL